MNWLFENISRDVRMLATEESLYTSLDRMNAKITLRLELQINIHGTEFCLLVTRGEVVVEVGNVIYVLRNCSVIQSGRFVSAMLYVCTFHSYTQH